MSLSDFFRKNRTEAQTIQLEEPLKMIAEQYQFEAVGFTNGGVRYEAGQNVRSCQLLAFGVLHSLTEEEVLSLFG
jgi:hypothetical protein